LGAIFKSGAHRWLKGKKRQNKEGLENPSQGEGGEINIRESAAGGYVVGEKGTSYEEELNKRTTRKPQGRKKTRNQGVLFPTTGGKC